MRKIITLLVLTIFASCSDTVYEDAVPNEYQVLYTIDSEPITALEGKTLVPSSVFVFEDKIYICNDNSLDIYDFKTKNHITSITDYIKGSTTIPFTRLSSIYVDKDKIYLGSIDSRIFILNKNTLDGFNTIGTGNWWDTFVHVFGLTISDGLLFVKEKETTISVFELSKITEESSVKQSPIAKLNTLKGFDEYYSMTVVNGQLIVPGQKTKSFLFYKISDIINNAESSLTTPLLPEELASTDSEPLAITSSNGHIITTEKIDSKYYVRAYVKDEFIKRNKKLDLSIYGNIDGELYGKMTGIDYEQEKIIISDLSSEKVRILDVKESTILEYE